MDNYYYREGWKPHSSHEMGKWERTIVTIISTPRFGKIRKCLGCDAEQAETVAGKAAHPELNEKCWAVELKETKK